jgi:hypothetical protein
MASDFSVAWQCLSKRIIGFSVQIKLHAHSITLPLSHRGSPWATAAPLVPQRLPKFPPFLLQGCQMVYFQTKNHNLSKFWRVLQWKMLVFCTALWSILRLFGIVCGHLVHFIVFWYISFLLYHEKSGNSVLLVAPTTL